MLSQYVANSLRACRAGSISVVDYLASGFDRVCNLAGVDPGRVPDDFYFETTQGAVARLLWYADKHDAIVAVLTASSEAYPVDELDRIIRG